MKKQIIRISLLLISASILNACQKEDAIPQEINKANAPAEPSAIERKTCGLEIFGDGFNGKRISLNEKNNTATYSPEGGTTYFSMQGSNGILVEGVFSGTKAGNCNSDCAMTLTIAGKTYAADNSVQITVEEYREIGEKIRGTFSGTFKRYDVNPETGQQLEYPVVVSYGRFEVVRNADL
jgi:hypothetical protein